MNSIEERNIKELKAKSEGKKFTLLGKSLIIKAASFALVLSLIPTIEYKIAYRLAKNNPTITQALANTEENKSERIAKLFAQSIQKNPHIDEQLKEQLIKKFNQNVIYKYGEIFTDDTIINMCAVASTEKIIGLSDFTSKHTWYSGSYNPYTNTLYVSASNGNIDFSVYSHEQIHAMLKSGMFGSGFATFIHGFGINEGITSIINGDGSYQNERRIFNALKLILGYESIVEDFFSSDLKSLKNELANYLPSELISKLFYNMDLNILEEYYRLFLSNNHIIPYEQYNTINIDIRNEEIVNILKLLFENKFNSKLSESKFGKFIMYSTNCFGLFVKDYGIDYSPNYYMSYVINYNKDIIEVEFKTAFVNKNGIIKPMNMSVSYNFGKEEIYDVDIESLSMEASLEFDKLVEKNSIKNFK